MSEEKNSEAKTRGRCVVVKLNPRDGSGNSRPKGCPMNGGLDNTQTQERTPLFPLRDQDHVPPGIARQLPGSARADAEILALVRARATGHRNAALHRRTLQEKVGLFADFEHFSRLCTRDLQDAFSEDREANICADPQATSRMTKNRRSCWLVAFRYYARHAGIEQNVKIVAIDRRGHYDCYLIGKTQVAGNWGKLVRLAEGFGIEEEQLRGCLPAAAERAASASGKRRGRCGLQATKP